MSLALSARADLRIDLLDGDPEPAGASKFIWIGLAEQRVGGEQLDLEAVGDLEPLRSISGSGSGTFVSPLRERRGGRREQDQDRETRNLASHGNGRKRNRSAAISAGQIPRPFPMVRGRGTDGRSRGTEWRGAHHVRGRGRSPSRLNHCARPAILRPSNRESTMQHRTAFILAVAALAGYPAVAADRLAPAEAPRRPNIAVRHGGRPGLRRPGLLRPEGDSRRRTSTALAAEGCKFTDFYAGSTVCAPSRCVLMTGLHTGHCRSAGTPSGRCGRRTSPSRRCSSDAGYATGLFGKWGLGARGLRGRADQAGLRRVLRLPRPAPRPQLLPGVPVSDDEERVPLPNVVPRRPGRLFGVGYATKKVEYSADLIPTRRCSSWRTGRQAVLPLLRQRRCRTPTTRPGTEAAMEIPDLGRYAGQGLAASRKKGHAAMIARLDRRRRRAAGDARRTRPDARTRRSSSPPTTARITKAATTRTTSTPTAR